MIVAAGGSGTRVKTGIEKTLAVREGVKRIVYSKTAVTVSFCYGLFSDDKASPDPASRPAALRAAPPHEKDPNPLTGLGPLAEFSSAKKVSPTGLEPVLRP